MGNIVTTNTGTLPQNLSSTSFAKIINDSLLELDLYSVDPTTDAPRVASGKGIFEVDYTNAGIGSRKKNSAGQFVDIKGLPYTMDTDSSSVVNPNQIYHQIDPSQSEYWKNISKYYNFKRGVCNASSKVPVNIAGVNFPPDWNDANPSTQTKQIQSCLISGTDNGPTSITAGNPEFNIPDINLLTDTLNIGPTGLTNQTVYGKPMTPTCSQLVNSILTNSYVLTDINNYTKLSSIQDSTITPSNFKIGKDIFLNYNTNDDSIKFSTNSTGSNYGTSSVSVQTAGGSNSEIKNAHLTDDCNSFYNELCNYYYYNDFIDGIQYNPNLLNAFTPSNTLLFGNNMNYITDHIPDCRCVNNLSVRDELVNPLPSGLNAIEYSYVANKCNSVTGVSTQYGANPGGSGVNMPQIVGNILNPYLSSTNYHPFGNQIDPVDPNKTGSASDMVDGTFLFAQQAREIVNTFNTYICNMVQTINANNNGAVTIAGISMNCNIGGNTNAPGNTPGATPGATPPPSSNNVSGNTYTFSVSIKNSLLNDYTEPVNPLTSLDAILTFDNQAYKFYNTNDNTPFYKFVFAPANSTSKSPTVTAKFGCGNDSNNNPYPASKTTCNNQTSFTIYTPFLYGTTTNEYGVDYYLVLQWGGVSNFINPSTPIPIMLKQYAMQIVDVIPGKNNSVNPSIFYLQFNIKFNCVSTPIVPYAIVLTPTSPANSTITITGTDFFSDVSSNKGSPNGAPYNNINSILADGSLTVGTSSVNVIQPDIYTYEILLNPDDTNTSGTPMNYNNTVVYKSSFDFTKLVSGFNNTTISYLDYNNNNQITLFSSTNAIANFGSTIVLNWSFVNAPGDNFKYFNIYYTVGSAPTSSANTTNALCQLNTYSIKNTSYQFMIPPFETGQKIYFNIEAGGSTSGIPPVFSNPLILTSTPAPTIFNGWNIIPTTTSAVTDEIKISSIGRDLAYLNSSSTIYDYLSHHDLSGMSGANAFVYDFTQKTAGNSIGGWFAAVFTPTTQTSGPSSVVVFQPLANNTLNFILTNNNNVIVSTNNPPSSPPTIQIGALISIEWTLGTSLKSDVQAQLYLYGILYQTFIIPKGTTTGNFKFTLYDLTGAVTNIPNVSMYITISNVITSPDIKLNINNPFISTAPTPSPISLSPTNPLAYINTDGTNIIKSVNVTLTNSLDNIFYNVFSGYNSPLIVNTHIITLKNINYSQPVKINVTNSSTSHFTNVYGKIRDSKKEHFGNITISPKNNKKKLIEGFVSNPSTSELIVNVLRLDLSQSSGFSKSVLVNYIFNNYKKVTIQSLELFFGTTNVDNSTFNISFIGQQVGTNKVINDSYNLDVNISTVRIIGIMTSQVFFPVTIPGATVVNYSPNTLTNGVWANTFELDNHNNGYYSIKSSDSSAVTTANNIALNISSNGGGSNAIVNSTPGAANPESSSGSNMLLYYGIGLILLILIGVGVYYMYFNKAKK